MSSSKQEYVGNILLVFNGGNASAPIISGVLEIEGVGYNVALWKAEGKDGKPTKLSYSGSMSFTGDDKSSCKRGYVNLIKPDPTSDKKYVMYGFINTLNDAADEYKTSHMVYLFKHNMLQGVLRGGVIEYEEYEKTGSNVPGIPSVELVKPHGYDEIPF